MHTNHLSLSQRYLGGLLCTSTGELPPAKDLDEIWEVFRSAEIEPWELFVVDNDETSAGALSAKKYSCSSGRLDLQNKTYHQENTIHTWYYH